MRRGLRCTAADGLVRRYPTRTRCRRRRRRTGARCSGRGRGRKCVPRCAIPVGRAAPSPVGGGVARCPARWVGCCGGLSSPSVRWRRIRRSRSCIPTTRPRRSGGRGRLSAGLTALATSSAKVPRRLEAARLGGCVRCRSAGLWRAVSWKRGRGRGTGAARHRTHPSRLHRRRQPRRERLGLTRPTPTQDVLRELFDWADVVAIARAGEQARVTLDVLDADRITRPETPLSALRRRLSGRYPVDPFGLDPQLADLCVPLFRAAVRCPSWASTSPRPGPR